MDQILVRGVDARSHADLRHRQPGDLRYGDDVIGAGWLCHQRFQRAEIQRQRLVVGRAGIGRERAPIVGAALCRQIGAGLFIAGEDGRCRAQFGAHVTDGGALVDGERGDAGAVVLQHLADAAFDGELLQKRQDHVLGGDPRRQRADQFDADDAGHGEVEGLSGHGNGDVESARADG